MVIFLGIIGTFGLVGSVLLFLSAASAIHEILAGAVLLIGIVSLIGAGVLEALHAIHKTLIAAHEPVV